MPLRMSCCVWGSRRTTASLCRLDKAVLASFSVAPELDRTIERTYSTISRLSRDEYGTRDMAVNLDDRWPQRWHFEMPMLIHTTPGISFCRGGIHSCQSC